jgi:hypothetical protein
VPVIGFRTAGTCGVGDTIRVSDRIAEFDEHFGHRNLLTGSYAGNEKFLQNHHHTDG